MMGNVNNASASRALFDDTNTTIKSNEQEGAGGGGEGEGRGQRRLRQLYYGAYFTEQNVLYFTLAFRNITFYFLHWCLFH